MRTTEGKEALDARRRACAEAYARLRTVAAVAAELGVPAHTVKRDLIATGNYGAKDHRKKSKIDAATCLEAFSRLQTLTAVATELGVGRALVTRVLAKENLGPFARGAKAYRTPKHADLKRQAVVLAVSGQCTPEAACRKVGLSGKNVQVEVARRVACRHAWDRGLTSTAAAQEIGTSAGWVAQLWASDGLVRPIGRPPKDTSGLLQAVELVLKNGRTVKQAAATCNVARGPLVQAVKRSRPNAHKVPDAVQLVLEGRYGVKQAALALGVNYPSLRRAVQHARSKTKGPRPGEAPGVSDRKKGTAPTDVGAVPKDRRNRGREGEAAGPDAAV